MARHRSADRELTEWLDRRGYRHSAKKKYDYVTYYARKANGRKIESPATGRPVFAAHERDHHITTAGRLALTREQFALPPGPEEIRRGIKGRLPIDDVERARNSLGRAKQMYKRGHISAGQLAQARRAVHKAWPSIEIEAA